MTSPSTPDRPKVSIVMPVYKGGRYFELALQSALAQTYPNIEIVVVNDGSPDGGETEEIALRYVALHPDKVRYFHQENTGVGGALNHGVRVMTGDIFCWLSHDDLFLPEKTQVQVDFWRSLGHPDAMLISDYTLIDPQGEQFADVKFDHDQFVASPMLPLYRGAVNGCTVFIPVHLLRRGEGPFDPARKFTQDFWLWRQLIQERDFFHLPRPLVRYRVHPGQDSQRPDVASEGETLWRTMVDELSAVQRAQLYGSSWRFYDETHRILEPSPYKETADYLADRRNRCSAETLVSVVIPFFNEVDLVRRALASVRAQTHRLLDIILVDDGSTEPLDGLMQDVEQDERVRIVRQVNAGPGAARNRGLGSIRGEYVCFLDADDLFLPTKIAFQLRQMARAGALVSHTSYLVSNAGESDLSIVSSGTKSGALYPQLMSNCPIATPTVMLHRAILAEGFEFPGTRMAEDVAAWVDLSIRHSILGLDTPLTLVERDAGTASTDMVKSMQGLEFLLQRFRSDPIHARQQTELSRLREGVEHLRTEAAVGAQRHAGSLPSGRSERLKHQELLLAQAEQALIDGDFATAKAMISWAARLIPTEKLLILRSAIYRAQGLHEQSLAVLERAARSPGHRSNPDWCYAKALTLVQLGRMQEAAEHLSTALWLAPESTSIAYARASVAAWLGQFDLASDLFSRPLPVSSGDGKLTSTAAIQLEPPRPDALDRMNASLKRSTKFDAISASSRMAEVDVVQLICCDVLYFDLFVEAVLRSLERKAGVKAGLHVHFINPDEPALRRLGELCAAAAIPVTFSSETASLDHLDERQVKTFYSCARYLVLPVLLRQLDQPVLVTDADQLVMRSLEPLLSSVTASDGALLVYPKNAFNFLSLTSASVAIAKPTPLGLAFFEGVATYLAEALSDTSKVHWHLDQAALAVNYLRNKHADIRALDPAIMRSDAHRGGEIIPGEELFWSVTYSIPQNASKLMTHHFKQHLAS